MHLLLLWFFYLWFTGFITMRFGIKRVHFQLMFSLFFTVMYVSLLRANVLACVSVCIYVYKQFVTNYNGPNGFTFPLLLYRHYVTVSNGFLQCGTSNLFKSFFFTELSFGSYDLQQKYLAHHKFCFVWSLQKRNRNTEKKRLVWLSLA